MPHTCTNHRCSERSTPGCGRRVCQSCSQCRGGLPLSQRRRRHSDQGFREKPELCLHPTGDLSYFKTKKHNTLLYVLYCIHPESTTSRMIAAHNGVQMDGPYVKREGDATEA